MLKTFLRRSCFLVVSAIAFCTFSSTVIGQTATITLKCDTPSDAPIPADQKTSKKKQKQDVRGASAKLSLPETTATKPAQISSLTVFTMMVGCTATATVRVTGGPPNQTPVYSMVQTNPANILGFKWNLGDPTTPSLQVPVQLDGTGFGISNVFHVKGLLVGQSTTYGETAGGSTTDTVDLSIIGCNCPSINISSPPRN